MWPEEVKDKYCPKYVSNHNVLSQQECQERCIGENGCVGISYSHKDNNARFCYVCTNDNLKSAFNNFGFYRRPGIVDVWLRNTKNESAEYVFIYIYIYCF